MAADGMVEELCLPLLHSSADVTVCDEADNLSIYFCNAQSKFAFAY